MTRITALLMATIVALAGLSFVAPAANAARPERSISINWKQVRTTSYVKIYGKAQDLKSSKLWLQRKIGKGGTWRAIKSAKSTSTGGYHFRTKVPHAGKIVFYRVKTKQTKQYKMSVSPALALHWV